MLSELTWLALEVKYLEPALAFYRDRLGLAITHRSDDEVSLAAGETDLILRPPGPVPRGGLHTHFAFSIPTDEYENWWDTLSAQHELVEHTFGRARSLYLYDPDGNCVELGQRTESGSGITGVFEVVLEVEDLDTAEAFYSRLGGAIVDRGSARQRLRLDLGPVDVELWEPQLGLADARGGVHIDLGFEGNPEEVATSVEELAYSIEKEQNQVRIKDPDGHWLTVRP